MNINKKMIRNLIIGVVALALLSGAYIWATKWQPEDDETQASQTEKISLVDLEKDAIAEVRINNQDGGFTIISKTQDNSTIWSVKEYTNLNLSKGKLSNLVTAISELNAASEITNDKNVPLSEFGFGDGAKGVVVRTKDGAEIEIEIGNKIAVDSSYYAMKKGDSGIYTISQSNAEQLLQGINAYRETTLGTINPETIKRLSITQKGKKVMELVKNPDITENKFRTSFTRMIYPYNEDTGVQKTDDLINAFGTIKVIDFVSDNPNDAAKYGIPGGTTVIVEDDVASHTIKFGDTAPDGNVYAMYNDKPFVFTMESTINDMLKDLDPFDYIDKFAHIYSIGKISKVEVSYLDEKHIMTVDYGKTDEDEDDEYFIDGKAKDDKFFKEVYQGVIGVNITQPVSGRTPGKEVARVTFTMSDGKIETSRYYEYDDRSLLLVKPSGKQYLVLRKYIESMIEEFR